METLILNFKSPKEMNEITSATKLENRQWQYADIEGSTLVLDTQTWVISCAENSQSAKINEWEVDESNFSMKLKSDSAEGDFVALDYTFSVAMVGQLVPPNELISYLKSLETVFKTRSQDTDNGNDDLPNEPDYEDNELDEDLIDDMPLDSDSDDDKLPDWFKD